MKALAIGIIVLVGFFGWQRIVRHSLEAPIKAEPSLIAHTEPSMESAPASASSTSATSSMAPQKKPDVLYVWKLARATVFWAGEGEGDDNGFIHNRSSAWDVDWEKNFGGYDDPECRDGYRPCGFVPKENPFYVALPYNDLNEDGTHKRDPRLPPGPREQWVSDLKDRWIAVRAGGKICYAQWEDVGPFGEDDIAYVFGDALEPLNQRGERAGIDLSPAARDCLGVGGLSDVEWRHVEASEVPDGPWLVSVTRQ